MPEYLLDPIVEYELWGIWSFIARDDPEAATRVIEAAEGTLATLAANPGLGRLRKFRNPRLSGIRSWHIAGFDNYLVFYRKIPTGIQVLHVYHGARDLESMFGER
jgi:toxin ParE1/3/4